MKSLSSLILGVWVGCQCTLSLATTAEDPNLAAVHKALIYLVQHQNTDGSWGQGLDDQMKATTEVYHALSLLSTLSAPRRAAGNWIKNTVLHDTEDKARADYVKRFSAGARPAFGQALFSSSDQVDSPLVLDLGGQSITIGTTSMALWGPFFDYKYSTIDTALSLRSLVHDIPYANRMQRHGIISAIDYLLEKRNQGEQASAVGSGWGFSSDDYSAYVNSQLIPTAYVLLALTEPAIKWATVSEGVLPAARWLVSKQDPTGRFINESVGDQSDDVETVLATLALAKVVARDDTDAAIKQAYHTSLEYLVAQLTEQGHIHHSPLLTALALQALPLTEITLVDSDRDQIPDAIEDALDFKLQGNGLLGNVTILPPREVLFVVAEPARYALVAGAGKTVELVSGQLPPGLALTNNHQGLEGTPTQTGSYDLHYGVLKDGRLLHSGTVHLQILDPDADPDNDGIPSGYELRYQLNPLMKKDAGWDADLDGWTNLEEFLEGTDPLVSNPRDTDGDGLLDQQEQAMGLNVEQADTDGDAMDDGAELDVGRNPRVNEPVLLLMSDVLF